MHPYLRSALHRHQRGQGLSPQGGLNFLRLSRHKAAMIIRIRINSCKDLKLMALALCEMCSPESEFLRHLLAGKFTWALEVSDHVLDSIMCLL